MARQRTAPSGRQANGDAALEAALRGDEEGSAGAMAAATGQERHC